VPEWHESESQRVGHIVSYSAKKNFGKTAMHGQRHNHCLAAGLTGVIMTKLYNIVDAKTLFTAQTSSCSFVNEIYNHWIFISGTG